MLHPKALFFTALLSLASASLTTAQNLEWVRTSSGEEGTFSSVWEVALGPSGSVYVTGGHQGSIDLSGDGTFDLHDRGFGDILLAKFDASGTLQWATNPGGLGIEQGRGVATDAHDNVYITGYVQENADFDDDGTPDVYVSGWDHLFLAKYDATGAFQWVRSFCGHGESVAVDPTGGIYVAGVAAFCADLDGDGVVDIAGRGAILARYDAEGGFEWYRSFDVGFHDVFGVAVAGSGDVYLTGSLAGSVDFDGDGIPDVTCSDSCMFVVAFERDGALRWVRAAGSSSGAVFGYDVAVTASGIVVVTGSFEGNVDFSGDGTVDARSAGDADVFVASYDPGGSLLWVDSLGSQHWDEGYGVATAGDNIYVTGRVSGLVDLDGDGRHDTPGGSSLFIVSYNADGVVNWARATSATGWFSTHGAIAASDNDVVIGGGFSGTMDLNGDGHPDAGPGEGLFVGRFSILGSTSSREETQPMVQPGAVLDQNYPNPFSSETRIGFSLNETARVSLTIYDAVGRRIATILDRMMPPGVHVVNWRPGETGAAVASGIYVYQLTVGTQHMSRTMFVVK
jgi:hypothetical protein